RTALLVAIARRIIGSPVPLLVVTPIPAPRSATPFTSLS
ncbi:hypothetical protein PENNAL_c0043G11550, partial [Penicillium nalgiovense]